MIPNGLKKGDTIGVVSTSEPITEENIEEVKQAVKKVEDLGLKVKFGKYAYKNPTGYRRNSKA